MAEKRKPTIQIVCTEDLQNDAADLARSFGLSTADFWRPIIEEYIELNREQIEKYRACMSELKKNPVQKPASVAKKKTAPKKKSKKMTDATTNNDSNPMTAQVTDKAGDDNG